MLKTPSQEKFKINQNNFNALRHVDRTFSEALKGKEITDHKKKKLGVILGSQFNIGTAVIDMPKLYKLSEGGEQPKLFIEEQPVIMWQPPWLEILKA
jgi:hypothetical protein